MDNIFAGQTIPSQIDQHPLSEKHLSKYQQAFIFPATLPPHQVLCPCPLQIHQALQYYNKLPHAINCTCELLCQSTTGAKGLSIFCASISPSNKLLKHFSPCFSNKQMDMFCHSCQCVHSSKHGQTSLSVPPRFCYLEMLLINRQSSISFSVAPVHAEPFPRMRSGYKPSSPGGMDKLCLSMFYHSYQCVYSSKHG